MWLTVNIIVLIIAICLIGYGKYIDSSENTEALMFFIFGIIFIGLDGVSELLRWIFG